MSEKPDKSISEALHDAFHQKEALQASINDAEVGTAPGEMSQSSKNSLLIAMTLGCDVLYVGMNQAILLEQIRDSLLRIEAKLDGAKDDGR